MRSIRFVAAILIALSVVPATRMHAQSKSDSTYIAEAIGHYLLGKKAWPLDSSKWYGETREMERSFIEAVQRQLHAEDKDMLPFCARRPGQQPVTAWFAMAIVKWEVDSAQVLVTRDGGRAGGCTGQVGQDFFLRLMPNGWRVDRAGPPRMSRTE